MLALYNAGYEPIILDNYSNSFEDVINNIAKIINKKLISIKGDIRDYDLLNNIFNKYQISAVIHCAALKAVNESLEIPIEYYDNNVSGSINLIKAMSENNINTLLFSSTCAVYGVSESMPVTENSKRSATNPYGHSKIMMEDIFMDLKLSENSNWKIGILRYFNPIGAHESGLIGERPVKEASNIMPNILKAAQKEIDSFKIYGKNYDTKDGTGIRDFIHIMDLVDGHIAALDYLFSKNNKELFIANLGTGTGVSVLELINAFEKVNNIKIPKTFVENRPGDIAVSHADPSYANQVLNWEAKRSLDKMCHDAWNFCENNNGKIK